MGSLKPLAVIMSAVFASQAFAEDAPLPPDELEEVVIVGFRSAIKAGLDQKRDAANFRETIIAEDIGKMPDLNLSESLQRVPGVAITREGGEGRQITVRGLGPTYTRVTLNGMEVPASTGGLDSSGGVNRGRSFDFNIFSSDLFRQINLNKTAVASIEEGGLASTVELYSMRPLDTEGFAATASAQASYNIHTGEKDPRITGVLSNSFADDKIGVLLGVNHTTRTVHQEGFGTVRWTGPASNFRGEDADHNHGWADTTSTIINGTPDPEANYPDYAAIQAEHPELTPLDYMWAPRLPRMDSFNHDQSRTGFVASLQAQPNDKLELNLNILKSKLDSDVSSFNYFAQFRNTHNDITPVEVTLNPSGRYIIAGTFDNVTPRSESRGQFATSEFTQIVASGEYFFTDELSLNVMLGKATSDHQEQQYRFNLTATEGHQFTYSFEENSNVAAMSYDFDILDPSNYEFTGPVLRDESVERENQTFRADLKWDFDDNGSNLKGGFIVNDRSIDSRFSDAPLGLTDPNAPSDANTNLLSDEVANYGDGIGGPSGFPKNWLVADFDVVRSETNAGSWTPEPEDSRSYIVSEDTSGVYVEANYFIGDWYLNGGVRLVETTVQGNKSDLKESYTNTLPAINVTYEPIENVLIRGAYSKNIARPNPANLSGAVSFTPLNGNISVANPGLKPEIADSIDLAVEWYFAEESYVGLAFFKKDISDSITSITDENVTLSSELQAIVAEDGAYDPTSPSFEAAAILPTDANAWNLTQSTNSSESDEIQGLELGFNYVFPAGIGVLGNYTTIDTDSDITGLSKNSYNLGVFYEEEAFSARVVVNSRDDYITSYNGSNANAEHGTTGPTRVDFSGSYKLKETVEVTLEVINLFNEKERLFTTGPVGDLNLIREYNTTGTELILGLRASF